MMTKEEATMIGFEIVAYSGDARSKLLLAIEKAKTKQFNECQALIDQANECLNDAHRAQTELLQLEARGESIEIGFITVHAQDHLMTTILLKDIVKNYGNELKPVNDAQTASVWKIIKRIFVLALPVSAASIMLPIVSNLGTRSPLNISYNAALVIPVFCENSLMLIRAFITCSKD